tara:strand:- start:481 stop:651 length:171 start_codon:yes stop_codon:yes gene_type:complete
VFKVGDLVKCKELPYLFFVVVDVLEKECDVVCPEDGKTRRYKFDWLSKIKTDIFCP